MVIKMKKNALFMSTADAAKELGYDESYIRRLIIEGKIKAEKLGKFWIISQKDLKKFKPKKGKK